jgi:hypothetical protein
MNHGQQKGFIAMRHVLSAVLSCTLLVMAQIALSTQSQRTGLSRAEAIVAANRFFAEEIAMEGAVAEPYERGDYWVFPVKFGYANVVAKDPILVDRFTGQASWAGLAEHNARVGRNKAGKSK